MPRRLSPQLQRVLDAVAAYWREHGIAPSYRDLVQAEAASSTSMAQTRVEQLAEQGFVRRGSRSQARALSLTEKGRQQAGK